MDRISDFRAAPFHVDELFISPDKKATCNATEFYLTKWNMKERFVTCFKSDYKSHLLTVGLYSVPLLGSAIKLVDFIIVGPLFLGWYNRLENSEDMLEKFESLQGNISQLQVNDLLFYFSRVIHLFALAVLGFALPEFIFSYVISDIIISMSCMLVRYSMGRIGLDRLFRTYQNYDLLNLREMAKSNQRAERDENFKNLLFILNQIFLVYSSERVSFAKKLIDSGAYNSLRKKYEQATQRAPHIAMSWEFIYNRLEQVADS